MTSQSVASLPKLRLGDSGESVQLLQEKLNLTADGKFGSGTEAAVKQFQADHGLSADGIVGAQTWSILLGDSGAPAVSARVAGSGDWLEALLNAPVTGPTEQFIEEAKSDLAKVRELATAFQEAAAPYGLPPAVLAGIASRESHCGAALDNGLGDGGNAFGIMQVDFRTGRSNPKGYPDSPDGVEHICEATEVFVEKLRYLEQKYPDWEKEYILKGAVAAYNVGQGNIQTKDGIDRGTAHDNYGSDAITRARYFHEQVFS